MIKENLKNQFAPIGIAILTTAILIIVLAGEILLLNLFPGDKIYLNVNVLDVILGLTIYLKTAIDFALLIGILMNNFPGFKNRVAIEVGTAVGNALGTMLILLIWYFFKEVAWLLALMIFIASLVLFKLAQTSIEHVDLDDASIDITNKQNNKTVVKIIEKLHSVLTPINNFLKPLLSKIVPDLNFKTDKVDSFKALLLSSFTIPFILGMDDFAGYVPTFKVVNVFGFGIGVFLGHMILNIFLFINPKKTIDIIKNPWIAIVGSIAFIGIAIWGLWEVLEIVKHSYLHF